MREAKPGEILEIDGIRYFVGDGPAMAINACCKALAGNKAGIKPQEIEVHLPSLDGKVSSLIPFNKVEEALAENIEK